MAGKNAKSKGPSGFGLNYLRAYNLIQTIGWSYILYLLFQNDYSSKVEANLWYNVKLPLTIFQNAAILEVIHAMMGLVSSNPALTFVQVASRVIVVCCTLLATPVNYSASSIGFPIALLAWSITEIIRYLYYFMNLNQFVPHFLTWLRYSSFIILYPIGITGELICLYAASRYALSAPEAYSYTFPNSWNFTFSFYYFLMIVMLTYIPGFPQLYLHMFAQRRKILGKGNLQKKAQ